MSTSTASKPEIVMDASGKPKKERLLSLDIFRGLTIAGMILVNDPGDWGNVYAPLRHSKWNGWTPTDLVFPFFLFIVGVSMVFSFSSRLTRSDTRNSLMLHALKRGVTLFAFGVFINGFPNHYNIHTLRFEGVLQRIALCYVISSFIFLWSGRKTWIGAAFSCLVGYWIIMRYLPVPGFGIPTHDIPLLDPDRNWTALIDRKLFMGHLYQHTNDPEGVLSTIPAVASTLLGMLTAEWLRSMRSQTQKALGMIAAGITCFLAGEIWNIWFPINKNLWTSSFVLLTAGLAMIGLGLCYWLFDVRKIRIRLADFFLVFGMNAIAAYVLSELLAALIGTKTFHSAKFGVINWGGWIFRTVFQPLASPLNASLLFAIAYVFFCWLVMLALYRKRIFLKI
ncbi:MAG TPA: heparan-alpha-glucosaminide N-acetyltransferase domain-containing protein [Terriglobales bacterium]